MKFVVKHFFLVHFFLFFVCSCSDRKSEQKCHEDILKDLNTNIGDPDTALVVFFWRASILENDFEENIFEIYIRVENEENTFYPLLFDLYGSCKDYPNRLKNINELKRKYREYAYSRVLEDAKNNNKIIISGEYYYMEATKDKDTLFNSISRVAR